MSDATNVITVNNAGYTDIAGNTGTGSTSSANYTVDTLRPTASVVVSDTQLGIGETSLVTVTFNEPVTGFTKADLSVQGGTISALTSADGGLTWTGTLTPSPGITVQVNRITLDNTGYVDASGNAGTGTTPSNVYSVDTIRPTATVTLSDSTLLVGESATLTLQFSEPVTALSNADLTIPNGTLSSLTSVNGGITWTGVFTPTAGVTDATNTISLANTGYTDLSGNAGLGSTNSANFVIDTQRPTSSITLSDSALRIGETSQVTFIFSEPVTNFSNNDITVSNGSLSQVFTVNQGLTWTATFTPTIDISDTTNVISLNNAGYTDLLGNAGIGTTISTNYIVDTVRPTATIVVADSSLTYGETSLVTITFSEAVTGFSNADLSVPNGILSPVTSSNGGVTWTATLTPNTGVQAANNTISLNNSGYTDVVGNSGTGATTSNPYSVNTIADDFGDLPDSYHTTLASDGPRHRVGTLFLGSGITIEPNGIPSAGANSDVDDGVIVPSGLVAGVDGLFRVTASQSGRLDAFVDFNNNGVFDASERITPGVGLAVTAGVNDVRFVVPLDAANGGHAARFRLSTAGGLAPTGAALDGEVEDYIFNVTNPANGTAQSVPDPARPGETMLLIKGTTGDDSITVAKSGAGYIVTIKGIKSPVLAANSRIVVFGLAGKDRITIATNITLPSLIDAGTGNDTVKGGGGHDRILGSDGDDTITGYNGDDVVFGGAGNDIIVGNAGANVLFGDSGNDKVTGQGVLVGGLGDDTLNSDQARNVLIGGLGKDILNAKTSGDILIGSRTDFDTNEAALRAIRTEWASNATVQTRIAHLTGAQSGGANGAFLLVSDAIRPGTIHDDLTQDTFNNTFAEDWLLPFGGDKRIRLAGIVNHS